MEMPVKVNLTHPKGVCGYAICDLLRVPCRERWKQVRNIIDISLFRHWLMCHMVIPCFIVYTETILTQSANQMMTGTCSYVASLAALSRKAQQRQSLGGMEGFRWFSRSALYSKLERLKRHQKTIHLISFDHLHVCFMFVIFCPWFLRQGHIPQTWMINMYTEMIWNRYSKKDKVSNLRKPTLSCLSVGDQAPAKAIKVATRLFWLGESRAFCRTSVTFA